MVLQNSTATGKKSFLNKNNVYDINGLEFAVSHTAEIAIKNHPIPPSDELMIVTAIKAHKGQQFIITTDASVVNGKIKLSYQVNPTQDGW